MTNTRSNIDTGIPTDILENLIESASVQQDVQAKNQLSLTANNNILGKSFMDIRDFITGIFSDVRRNVVTNQTEYLETNGEYIAIDDLALNSIFMRMNAIYPKATTAQLIQYLNSQDIPAYNPFGEYFNKLTAYSPTHESDYLTELCTKFDVHEDEQQRLRSYLRTWLIGVYVQALEIELNDNMLIFIGEQGTGKSRFASKIIPKELKTYFLPSEQLNKIDKDFILKLSQNICLEIDELDLSKAKQNELKNIISKTSATERQAYARYSAKYPRRASLIGSSNMRNILGDVTGSRRFLIVEINQIHVDKISDDLVKNVYRQMIYEYNQAPSSWRLSPIEVSQHNEIFRSESFIEELISTMFKFEECTGYDAKVMRLTEILQYLNNANSSVRLDESNKRLVSKAMTALKIKSQTHRIDGEVRKGYKVFVPSYYPHY